jgi:uncharacterized repeat protein (TIGR03803 family)
MKPILPSWARASALACLLCAPCLTGVLKAQSPQPTLKVLYTFKAQGGTPTALVEVIAGTFLGVSGTSPGLFSITSSGTYNYFYVFPINQGGIVATGLTNALNAQTYGAASNLGPVTTFSELFSVAPGDKVTTYSYNGATQGAEYLPLVQSPDGYLYGSYGVSGGPAIFNKQDYSGSATNLYTFSAGQGVPYVLFLGMSADFYGLSVMPSNTGKAGIFSLTPGGSFSWIVPSMPLAGAGSYAVSLIEATNGNFYGTQPEGGTANAGTIYQVTPSGAIKTLYEFSNPQTGFPETLLQASDGMLYGTARGEYYTGFHGYSSVFRLDPSSGAFQTIFSFKDLSLGECPCRMVQGSDGKLYGASEDVGTYGGGTIWQLDAGITPPLPGIGSIVPQAGSVGQKVLLWGKNLLGATSVTFNGTSAKHFSVPSSQGVWAWVPEGAATGPVTITTPNGSFTTTASFTVQ